VRPEERDEYFLLVGGLSAQLKRSLPLRFRLEIAFGFVLSSQSACGAGYPNMGRQECPRHNFLSFYDPVVPGRL
jgi:hypothetical protein